MPRLVRILKVTHFLFLKEACISLEISNVFLTILENKIFPYQKSSSQKYVENVNTYKFVPINNKSSLTNTNTNIYSHKFC